MELYRFTTATLVDLSRVECFLRVPPSTHERSAHIAPFRLTQHLFQQGGILLQDMGDPQALTKNAHPSCCRAGVVVRVSFVGKVLPANTAPQLGAKGLFLGARGRMLSCFTLQKICKVHKFAGTPHLLLYDRSFQAARRRCSHPTHPRPQQRQDRGRGSPRYGSPCCAPRIKMIRYGD